MYKPNSIKEELINEFGAGYGTPLFSQQKDVPVPHKHLPDWICDASGIKAEIYNKLKDKFADDSLHYLNAIINLGGNATDHEVKSFFSDETKWPLAIVSARRNYFKNGPFYIITTYPDKSGKPISRVGPMNKPNTVWFVDFKKLYMLLLD